MKAIFRTPLLAAAVCAASSIGEAASAPRQLLNKTVILQWQTSGISRNVEGRTSGFSNAHTRTIYISTAGRTFVRWQYAGLRNRSRGGDRDPDSTSHSTVHFDGNKLVGVETFENGARQFAATFDASFSTCTLAVIDGKSGSARVKRRGTDGALYELDSVSTTAQSCSVKDGNALAGQ